MKKKWLGLGIPLFIILLFLVKIAHTIYQGNQNDFVDKKGGVFLEKDYMQDFESDLPIQKAIYAVVKVRKETSLLDDMEKYSIRHQGKPQYYWIAAALLNKDNSRWIVSYRENGVTPKMICSAQVVAETGAIEDYKCQSTDQRVVK